MTVDPFDLSKALDGAKQTHLDPAISKFVLHAEYEPSGDQNNAIEETISQLEKSQSRCVMLGVTGSGKTFAMANIIEKLNIPTLILSH
ncbi:MAG: DEAD/DEAH box helicase family protein, partial [Candidatus Thermoplasmatota archaeon]|nr:DEAD/DEAH box helicase family protein [Candidatus Thermoplasmatota archaeon]